MPQHCHPDIPPHGQGRVAPALTLVQGGITSSARCRELPDREVTATVLCHHMCPLLPWTQGYPTSSAHPSHCPAPKDSAAGLKPWAQLCCWVTSNMPYVPRCPLLGLSASTAANPSDRRCTVTQPHGPAHLLPHSPVTQHEHNLLAKKLQILPWSPRC